MWKRETGINLSAFVNVETGNGKQESISHFNIRECGNGKQEAISHFHIRECGNGKLETGTYFLLMNFNKLTWGGIVRKLKRTLYQGRTNGTTMLRTIKNKGMCQLNTMISAMQIKFDF
jgi:hypothetical protein